MRFDFVSFRVKRQQQREPYTGNPYVRFMRRVEAGNRFFLFYVCLAWPFAWWCKSTFLNCLFRGIVEDDPEGLASPWGDGNLITVRLWVKEAADKIAGQNASEPTGGTVLLTTRPYNGEVRCIMQIKTSR